MANRYLLIVKKCLKIIIKFKNLLISEILQLKTTWYYTDMRIYDYTHWGL